VRALGGPTRMVLDGVVREERWMSFSLPGVGGGLTAFDELSSSNS